MVPSYENIGQSAKQKKNRKEERRAKWNNITTTTMKLTLTRKK